ncbi:hypothetical protein M3231_12605 [Neobacillus mesonae]|nr:hypothetical protein [Neobacillus mesonae]
MESNATITVNFNDRSKHKISPYLFGHFVEDIRDHMDAMLAYPLKDMDFESEAETKAGVSGSWSAFTNGRTTKYGLESPAPGHSGRVQRIRIWSDAALKGPLEYSVKLVARASGRASLLAPRSSRPGDPRKG